MGDASEIDAPADGPVEGDARPDAEPDASDATAPPAESCGPDQIVCDSFCAPVHQTELHCGECGVSCASAERCIDDACSTPATAPHCETDKVTEVLAQADNASPTVTLDCSLTLAPTDVVTKKVEILGAAGTGVVLDCQGATLRRDIDTPGPDTLVVGSLEVAGGGWERPSDVVVRSCRIEGSVRIQGLGPNGQSPAVRDDSLSLGHRERAQAAAPTRVLLDRLTIIGAGRIPLYLAPGVTRVTLQDSEITGQSNSTVIYLDAESAFNRIVRNRFDATTVRDGIVAREIVAVDGSADNVIAMNELRQLEWGGIYLYRNCGEGRAVRHQEPRRNVITGNAFVYTGESGRRPTIWVGSRNELTALIPGFCGLDDGHAFGSSISNLDYARDTVIAENQISGFPPEEQAFDLDDAPTYVIDNASTDLTAAPVPAGCALFAPGEAPRYLRHEEHLGARQCVEGELR